MADTKHRDETEMLEVKPLNDIHPTLKDRSGDEIDLFDLKIKKKPTWLNTKKHRYVHRNDVSRYIRCNYDKVTGSLPTKINEDALKLSGGTRVILSQMGSVTNGIVPA